MGIRVAKEKDVSQDARQMPCELQHDVDVQRPGSLEEIAEKSAHPKAGLRYVSTCVHLHHIQQLGGKCQRIRQGRAVDEKEMEPHYASSLLPSVVRTQNFLKMGLQSACSDFRQI